LGYHTRFQLLLAWAIRPVDDQPGDAQRSDARHDVIAIPKAVQSAHVAQNAAALGITLDDDALKRLDAAFPAPASKVALDIV
jgi:aryl-alcohol dehydrogenase-like predicted oxidoreductase